MDNASNVYMIAVADDNLSDEQVRQLLVFISNNKMFEDWHSPFRGMMFVESNHIQSTIAKNIQDFLGSGIRFMVVRMVQGEGYGYLASESWDWLKSNGRYDVERD